MRHILLVVLILLVIHQMTQSLAQEPPQMYYINLDSRPERRRRIEGQLDAINARATRVRAHRTHEVSSRVIGETWVADLNSRYDTRQDPFKLVELSPGERGCAGSHAHVWRQTAQSASPIVIFEDDAMLQPLFRRRLLRAMRLVHQIASKPPVLYLEHIVAKWGDDRFRVESGFEVRSVQYAWNLCGYVVWPSTLRILLDNLPMREPVDNYIARLTHEGKIAAYACDPMIVRQFCTHCDGDILHTLRH